MLSMQLIVAVIFAVCYDVVLATEYKFVAEKFERVLEEENIISSKDLKYEKRGDDIVFNGELKQLVDFDNTWQVQLTVERSVKDEKFVTVMALPPMGVCVIMSTHYKNYFYESLKQHSNAPDPDKCPVVATTYTVNEYALSTSSMRKHLKPGQYRIKCVLLHEGKSKAEYVVEGNVVEA